MDRRAIRGEQSRTALKAAFLELFRTKEPEDISVVELCRKAGVNRSTFYAHYEYMDQLIQEVLRDSVAEVCEGFTTQWDLPLENGGVARDLIHSYLRHFLANPTLRRFCTCVNSGRYRVLIVRAQVEVSLGPTPDPVRYYTAYCHNAGVLNCVQEWLNNEKPISSDDVMEIIHESSKIMYRFRT
nr:TetR/AcrR family transcriptional regulator [Lachnospiraceae bacterium]